MEKCKTLHDVSMLSGPVPYRMMEVVWDDACTDIGWEGANKKIKHELVLTVGFLVQNTDEHIVIASTICEGENDTNCRIQIPLGMIKHIREIQ